MCDTRLGKILTNGLRQRTMGGRVSRQARQPDSAWEQDATLAPHCVRCSAGERLEARLREMLAADWASELQTNDAQPKRVSSGHYYPGDLPGRFGWLAWLGRYYAA